MTPPPPHPPPQYALYEDEVNKKFQQQINKKTAAKILVILCNQGCFALDCHELVGNTIERLEMM